MNNSSKQNLKRLWREILSNPEYRIASASLVDDIVNLLLVPDNISHNTFINNFQYLLNQEKLYSTGMFTPQELSISPSLEYFRGPGLIVPSFPLWFYAAYPDVMEWLHSHQKETLNNNQGNGEMLLLETGRMLGIEIGNKNLKLEDVFDELGCHLPKYLRNLADKYKNTTNNEYELSNELFQE